MGSGTTTAPPSTPADRRGLRVVDDAAAPDVADMDDSQRIQALEAEVAALKASNACLVQTVDWLRTVVAEFRRAAVLSAELYANAAAVATGNDCEKS